MNIPQLVVAHWFPCLRRVALWCWYSIVVDRAWKSIKRAWACNPETLEVINYSAICILGAWLVVHPHTLERPAFAAMLAVHKRNPGIWAVKYNCVGWLGMTAVLLSCNYWFRAVMVVAQWVLIWFTTVLIWDTRSDAWILALFTPLLINAVAVMIKLFLNRPRKPANVDVIERLKRFRLFRSSRWKSKKETLRQAHAQ